MTPGDMGQAVAMQIKARGFAVCTALEKRSERSRTLAREAGLTDLGSIARLAAECDVVLSIMNPAAALDFAREAAGAIRAARSSTLVVDCNAIAPGTAVEAAAAVGAAGGSFLDGGIIGPPPRGSAKTTIYVSGPGAADLAPLAGPQLEIVVVSERIGDASALKMCSGALTKGTQVLWLEVLTAARRLGVDEFLARELRGSRSVIRDWVMSELPIMAPKTYRWVPEMLEVAKTLRAAGSSPRLFEGVADVCGFVSGTALGRESPEENREARRSGADVVRLLAEERAPKR
jgi:3-hydroxyisobutyrate dehydrogenase-like beta-hydroxyacid dehydrogenase